MHLTPPKYSLNIMMIDDDDDDNEEDEDEDGDDEVDDNDNKDDNDVDDYIDNADDDDDDHEDDDEVDLNDDVGTVSWRYQQEGPAGVSRQVTPTPTSRPGSWPGASTAGRTGPRECTPR